MTLADDDVAAIEAGIAAGDDGAAFARLRTRLDWPHGRELAAAELPTWFGLLATLADRRGAHELAAIAAAAARDPASPDRLYELGYAMIDAGGAAIAASALWHCLSLVGDSEEVVCELVSALERAMAHRDALEILRVREALRSRSPMSRYLYAFNAAMSGELSITRATLPTLAADTDEGAALQATIAGIVERADQLAGVLPLDDRDLRGWHYVLTGGLLTHQSPYGFDTPMHGRYAWLSDSNACLRAGVERLAALAAVMHPPCVFVPEGRDHEVVGHVVARRLGVPLVPWPSVGVPAPGVIAIYDLAALPPSCAPTLVDRRADQLVFAHASPWTVDSPIAPDVTTLLYQSLVPPWGERTVVDAVTRRTVTRAADPRSPEDLATEVLASPEEAAVDAADQPARWAALVDRVWPHRPGPRARLWAGSPVPSNRF